MLNVHLVHLFKFIVVRDVYKLIAFLTQVGGVHSHLISRVQRDKSRAGSFMSQTEIMTTVFPMFQQHIEPHLVHAHVSLFTVVKSSAC